MMDSIDEKTTVTTKRSTVIKLTGKQIVDLLRETKKIPDTAIVEFRVPGGGDWSNMTVDVTNNNPIIVSYDVTAITQEGSDVQD